MIMFAFSVRDDAVGAYLPVFFARSKGEAIRSFTSAVNDEKHQFGQHKGDYALYLIGLFDDNTGELTSQGLTTECPSRLLSANEVAPV